MKRVLVVDDEPVIRSLVQASFAADDCAVVGVPDGLSALEAARREQPDLILLDLGLPGMSGNEVARLLKLDARTASIPVLFLTGLAPSHAAQGAVIAKPFTPSQLRERAAAWL
jgi:CheY-like chemotaxis protein